LRGKKSWGEEEIQAVLGKTKKRIIQLKLKEKGNVAHDLLGLRKV